MAKLILLIMILTGTADNSSSNSRTITSLAPPAQMQPVPPGWFPNLIENGDFEYDFPHGRSIGQAFHADSLFVRDKFDLEPGYEKSNIPETFHGPGGNALFINARLIRDPDEVRSIPSEIAKLLADNRPIGQATLRYKFVPPLIPGRAYIFEAWLFKDRNIDGIYPSVSLLNRNVRLSDFWQSGKWQKTTLIFQAPLRTVRREENVLRITVPRGEYTLAIDSVSLRELRVVPLWPGDRSTFKVRGLNQPPTNIDFLWQIPDTDRLLGIVLKIRKVGEAGYLEKTPQTGGFEFKATNASETRSIAISNDSLSPGAYEWRIEVRQYRVLLASSNWRLLKIAETNRTEATSVLPDEPESTRARSSTKVQPNDGPQQPNSAIFPIGIYNGDTADFAELKEMGFNAVHLSPLSETDLMAKLDSARRNGLRVLLSPDTIKNGVMLGNSALNKSRINALSDSILAWYLDDEPEGRAISPKKIFLGRQELRGQGFVQPGAISICRSWRANDYAPGVDIFMSDPYPVPFEPLSWLAECLDEIGTVIAGDPARSVWSVIQLFDWTRYFASPSPGGSGRLPTAAELKAMATLALIHNARGLFFYPYRDGPFFIKDQPDLWEGLKSLVHSIRSDFIFWASPSIAWGPRTAGKIPLSKSLTSRPCTEYRIECDSTDAYGHSAVHWVVKKIIASAFNSNDSKYKSSEYRQYSSGSYLVIVNTLDKPVKARFFLHGAGLPLDILLTPLECRLITLDQEK